MSAPSAVDSALLPDDDAVAFYRQHGWWISPPILSADDLEEAWYGVERYYEGERDIRLLHDTGTDWTPRSGDVLRQNDYVSLQVDELARLVRLPVIGATAARLAGTSEVRLFHDQLIWKPSTAERGTGTVGWHTDISYWHTCSSRNMITAWIPFQDVTENMGPMTFLDRSHRWDGNDTLDRFHHDDLDAIAQEVSHPHQAIEEVAALMPAGCVSFHHCRTIHGGRPNIAGQPRVALAVHMQDAENHYTQYVGDQGQKASHFTDFLCRSDADGNPDYHDPDICPVLWRTA